MSEVQKLVLDALEDASPRPIFRLTLRLPVSEHEQLVLLASVTNTTKTALAERILRAAVRDAFSAYLQTLSDPEAYEVTRQLDFSEHVAVSGGDGSGQVVEVLR
jgi:hypothetical protein